MGDVVQLPSIGPGAILADIIGSNVVSTVTSEIFRQAATSQIIVNTHRINQGKPLVQPTGEDTALRDFYVIPSDSPEDIQAKLLRMVTDRIPNRFGLHPIQDAQVLTPMNRSSLGSRVLNEVLQQALNQDAAPKVSRFGWAYAPGNQVIQTVNDYEKDVFNGDIGHVVRVDSEDGTVAIAYDGLHVDYEFGELDEVALVIALRTVLSMRRLTNLATWFKTAAL
jgi:exodeoxyribonuclease V alpha subunit